MDISDALKSAARALKGSAVREAEAYLVPVSLQRLYKGYKLRETTPGRIGMPLDFLITLAQLSDHIYLTGTRRGDSRSDSPAAVKLERELGVLFKNYMQIQRFDAATGLAFETRGPFGAVVASAVPPGMEQLHVKAAIHPDQARYRLFIVFRGTVQGLWKGYTDDLTTDGKCIAPKRVNSVGNRAGDVARGFLNTYDSCRFEVMEGLLRRGLAFLREQYRAFAGPAAGRGGGAASGPIKGGGSHPGLPMDRVEFYVVGHSLGGAVATLCAYDIACRFPHYNPVLVTFGSPPVGNIDFAIDFNKVMVERDEYHPRTRFLRSIRVVARAADGHLDYVSALPEHLPNYIHVNTRVVIPSAAGSRWGAHSIAGSYIPALSTMAK